jgi:hypothetical protein
MVWALEIAAGGEKKVIITVEVVLTTQVKAGVALDALGAWGGVKDFTA